MGKDCCEETAVRSTHERSGVMGKAIQCRNTNSCVGLDSFEENVTDKKSAKLLVLYLYLEESQVIAV